MSAIRCANGNWLTHNCCCSNLSYSHFLFNSLHTISAMMRDDICAADQMLARLSDLLRLTIDSIGQHEITLKQELEFVQKYLEIERIRFQERILLELNIAPECLDAMVPSMVLQPLVENSIRHGFGASVRSGEIRIDAKRVHGKLRLTVWDSGKGFAVGVVNGTVQGLGLANTRLRLEQLYGPEHGLECINLPTGGAAVSIELTFHTSALAQSAREGELICDEHASVDSRRREVGAKTNRYAPQI